MAQKLFGEQLAKDLATLSKNLEIHEKVCEERSKFQSKLMEMMSARQKRMEAILYSGVIGLYGFVLYLFELK